MFKYFLYTIGHFIVNHFSLAQAYNIGIFLSDVQYCFSPRDRRSVRNNLKRILKTDKNINTLSREVFRNFGKYLVEFFTMKKTLDNEFIKNKVIIKDLQYIDQALARGKGVILLSAHLGNFELGAAIISKLGYSLAAIALPHKERPVNDLFNQQREFHGIEVIPTHLAMKHCLERLKNNGIIAILGDRDFSKHGEVMDFLNGKALIPKGPAIFSGKTGAPIVPVFLIRNDDGTFTLSLHKPVFPGEVIEEIVKDSLIISIIKQYLSVIEDKIKQYPAQWLMFRDYCSYA